MRNLSDLLSLKLKLTIMLRQVEEEIEIIRNPNSEKSKAKRAFDRLKERKITEGGGRVTLAELIEEAKTIDI